MTNIQLPTQAEVFAQLEDSLRQQGLNEIDDGCVFVCDRFGIALDAPVRMRPLSNSAYQKFHKAYDLWLREIADLDRVIGKPCNERSRIEPPNELKGLVRVFATFTEYYHWSVTDGLALTAIYPYFIKRKLVVIVIGHNDDRAN